MTWWMVYDNKMKFDRISDSDGMIFKESVIAGKRVRRELPGGGNELTCPPTLPSWTKVKPVERAEGVAVLSTVIHVSVKAKTIFD